MLSSTSGHDSLESAGAAGPVLRFENVHLAFDGLAVLRGVSFIARRGETKVLLGEAASGKTLLLKLALGLQRPDSGAVWVLGQPVSDLPESRLFALRRHIGMVFQESALFDSLSVRENVAYRLREEHELTEDTIEQRVRRALSFVELEEAIDKMPGELSGGMKRRVAIARALSSEPEVMLYDSPTGGLDPITSTTIMELIIKLRDENNVTSLLVTHRLQDAYLLATHVWDTQNRRLRAAAPERSHTSFLLLREGKVWFDGDGHQLMNSGDDYVKTFME